MEPAISTAPSHDHGGVCFSNGAELRLDEGAESLLARLRELDIRLVLEEGKLRCSAPKGRLTPSIQREIGLRRDVLLRYLSERSVVSCIPKADRAKEIPLTFAQESLYFLHRLQPENTAYNLAAYLEIADVAIAALQAALGLLVDRHEMLRTSFVANDGVPSQVIGDWVEPELGITDLRGVPGPEGAALFQTLVREQANRSFDLSKSPLFRVTLVLRHDQPAALVLIIHHIIGDATSIGILFREVKYLYECLSQGVTAALPGAILQYADFAGWQRSALRSQELASDLDYWRGKLKGSRGVLELPTDRPRSKQRISAGSAHEHDLGACSGELKGLAREERASLFMMLLTVFHALLHRWTSQSEILIGTPADLRDRAELEGLVGMFVNTLVLKAELPAGITGRELLRQVRETVMEAHEHSSTSFEKLVEIADLERDLSRSPLVQVLFALQNTTNRSAYWTVSTGSMFDLSLFAMEHDGSVRLAIEYCDALFDAGTIARMAEQFERLARGITAHPDLPISSLSILTTEDWRLLEGANQTDQPYPRNLCVHQWIGQQCRLTPDAVAVAFPGQTLTYSELDERANRLAGHLQSLGVGPEVLVGVLLERSAQMVVALLAVLKAGGAYVPLDPSYPKDRLAFMLEDSRAAVLVTQQSLLNVVPASRAVTVCLDHLVHLLDQPAGESASQLTGSGVQPDHCAYVIYTSGSTGTPKGVQVLHRAVVNFLASMQREPGLSAQDRLLAVTTLSFDIAGLELYLPLVTGARVIVAPQSAVADGAALARMLEEWQITVMQATPVTWRLLLEAGWQGTPGLKILCGGEALNRELANRLLETGAEVWNLYGPTETTIWSAVQRMTAGDGPVTIGRPIANTRLYVLDGRLEPVPPGAVGELYIAGDGLARGYLARPELTAARFLDDPFQAGGKMYRTGDLARMLPGGFFECLGRVDQQVKLRGFRIELGEIETVLERQPGIHQAVVIVREDSPGDQRLTAYLLSRDRNAAQPQKLREALHAKLPDYMVPSAYVFLDAFPLTPNRKVDRQLLPKPEAASALSAQYVPPETGTEKQVAAIWQALLKTSEVGVNENFFDLGGHSLLVVQLQSRLRREFGRELSIQELFEHPTVGSIARLLHREAGEEDSTGPENYVVPRCKSLTALRSSGSNAPLFVVPGISGSVVTCTRLTAALGPKQPVYGFHARGLDGREAPLDRVEDLAAAYLREMRTVQKHGPYHLVGVCIGGATAFEMARLLEAEDESVATLAMIQTWFPESFQPAGFASVGPLRPALFLSNRIRQHAAILRTLSGRERVRYVRSKAALLVNTLTGRNVHQPLREDLLEQVVQQANYSAIARYRPGRLEAPLILMLAGDADISPDGDPRLQWAQFTGGGTTIHRLHGSSTNALVVEPEVFEVARILTANIEATVPASVSAGV